MFKYKGASQKQHGSCRVGSHRLFFFLTTTEQFLGRAMLNNVTQMSWWEFMLAKVHLLILQRTLEIELSSVIQNCWGDISGPEATSRTSLQSQLEVYRIG